RSSVVRSLSPSTVGNSSAGEDAAVMDELALSCYGVEVRLVDAAGLALCQRLHDTLPPEFAAPSEPAEAVVAYVVTAGVRPGTAEPPEYLITCDGVAVFAT